MNQHLIDLYKSYSDDDLHRVLLLREEYEPEAVEIALEEALSRGLINDKNNLPPPHKDDKGFLKNLFSPHLLSERQAQTATKGIQRFIFFVGIGFAALFLFAEKNSSSELNLIFAGLALMYSLIALILNYIPGSFINGIFLILSLFSAIAFYVSYQSTGTVLMLHTFLFFLSAFIFIQYIKIYPAIKPRK